MPSVWWRENSRPSGVGARVGRLPAGLETRPVTDRYISPWPLRWVKLRHKTKHGHDRAYCAQGWGSLEEGMLLISNEE